MFGTGFHESGMRDACDCYEKPEQAQARWKQYILEFYKVREEGGRVDESN